jgi:hypothetical protein
MTLPRPRSRTAAVAAIALIVAICLTFKTSSPRTAPRPNGSVVRRSSREKCSSRSGRLLIFHVFAPTLTRRRTRSLATVVCGMSGLAARMSHRSLPDSRPAAKSCMSGRTTS